MAGNYGNQNYRNNNYNSNQNYQDRNVINIEIPQDLSKINAEEIVKLSDKLGNSFTGIKTNQIRNVYSNITLAKVSLQKKDKIENVIRTLVLLKPKLAYAAGRQNAVRPFQEKLSKLIDSVVASEKKEEALVNFFDIVEGIVAYHKFYGGKDN